MAAVIQELLRSFDLLSIESRVDIIHAIQNLYKTRQIEKVDVYLLRQFASGYSIQELALAFPSFPVRERLAKTFSLVAEVTRNTDEAYLQGVLRAYPKFRNKADSYRKKLQNYNPEETDDSKY